MSFDLKDLFQFGVPTVLLGMLLWFGLPILRDMVGFLKDWLTRLILTLEKGLEKVEEAAKERDVLWQGMLSSIHKEDRDDRMEDRKLRHETNNTMNSALLQLRETVDLLRETHELAEVAKMAVTRAAEKTS